MTSIPITTIAESVEGLSIDGAAEDVCVDDVTVRSADVRPGSLFCCVRGASSDGHRFAADAVSSGATALLVEPDGALTDVDPAVPRLICSNVREVLGPVADLVHGMPSSRIGVYGVTGTNGKTTTTHILASILEAAEHQTGMIGTVGVTVGRERRETSFTTPEAPDLHRLLAEMVAGGDTACAIEVSSHALDQDRTRNVRFAAVGFTNLTRDHLDYHRGFEPYYLAKRRLFTDRGPEGQVWPAAVNCDDEWGSRLFDELVHSDREDVPVWGYTLNGMNRASVSAQYELVTGGAVIDIESPAGDFQLRSPLHGRFNVENVLCAVSMALLGGVDVASIQGGLDHLDGVPGRFQAVEAGQDFSVFVDYAHTPDSLEKVLASARDLTQGAVHVVFGCGGDRDRSKRPMMGRAAARAADTITVTSDNPRSEDPEKIIKEILAGTRGGQAEVVVEVDRRAAIEKTIARATSGDVVVVAGKGHEQGQTFADRVVPFDDVEVTRSALAALAVG